MIAPEKTLVAERVALVRQARNPTVVAQMPSGWLVMADKQVLPGQLILLADPVTASLNTLDASARAAFLADMARAGDAHLAATGCARVNYEILGNTDPALHAHIVPRYASEPAARRKMPIWLYGWSVAEDFSETRRGTLREAIAQALHRLTAPPARQPVGSGRRGVRPAVPPPALQGTQHQQPGRPQRRRGFERRWCRSTSGTIFGRAGGRSRHKSGQCARA